MHADKHRLNIFISAFIGVNLRQKNGEEYV